MNGNQLTYENVFRWFLSPLARTSVTMSMYFLFGLLTLLDLLRLLVCFCTRSGGLGTKTLGLALLLSPDPGDIMGLSLSTNYGWGMLTCTAWVDLGVLNSCFLVFPAGGVCSMLGGLAATLGWAVDWGLGGLAAILSISVVCCSQLLSMVGAVEVTDRGTSLIYILFCLWTPFAVFTKYEWGSQPLIGPLLR